MSKKSIDIIEDIQKEILSKRNVNLILAGGKSPLKIYKKLFAKNINWSKVNLFLSDERLVSLDNKNSNFFNIKKQFKKNIKYNIFPLNRNSIKQKNSNRIFKKIKNYYTISILGMGMDGHFASIFLKDKEYKKMINVKQKPKIWLTQKIGKPKVKRLTLNLSGILLANKIFLIVNNQPKKSILLKSLKQKNDTIPLAILLQKAKKKLIIFKKNI